MGDPLRGRAFLVTVVPGFVLVRPKKTHAWGAWGSVKRSRPKKRVRLTSSKRHVQKDVRFSPPQRDRWRSASSNASPAALLVRVGAHQGHHYHLNSASRHAHCPRSKVPSRLGRRVEQRSKAREPPVPQFYLRYFACAPKRTNLFNLPRQLMIPAVSIKHQCSRHNFYEFAPNLEDSFADLEANAARVIRRVEAHGHLPDEESDDWLSLLAFIVFQHLRTSNAAKSTDAYTEYFGRLVVENDPKLADIDPNSVKLRNVYAVAMPLSIAPDILPLAHDLRAHLFVNTTGREFITSDDPVVLHNQYCEGITYQGVNGWACAGIQVFWPISPKKLIVLYDRDTYVVPESSPGARASKLSREFDVAQLNSLQILNAHHNVYFAGRTGAGKVLAQCRELCNRRPKTRATFVETEAADNADGTSSAILHSFQPLLPVELRVSKIRVNRRMTRIPLRDRSHMYRSDHPRRHASQRVEDHLPQGMYRVKKTTRI